MNQSDRSGQFKLTEPVDTGEPRQRSLTSINHKQIISLQESGSKSIALALCLYIQPASRTLANLSNGATKSAAKNGG